MKTETPTIEQQLGHLASAAHENLQREAKEYSEAVRRLALGEPEPLDAVLEMGQRLEAKAYPNQPSLAPFANRFGQRVEILRQYLSQEKRAAALPEELAAARQAVEAAQGRVDEYKGHLSAAQARLAEAKTALEQAEAFEKSADSRRRSLASVIPLELGRVPQMVQPRRLPGQRVARQQEAAPDPTPRTLVDGVGGAERPGVGRVRAKAQAGK